MKTILAKTEGDNDQIRACICVCMCVCQLMERIHATETFSNVIITASAQPAGAGVFIEITAGIAAEKPAGFVTLKFNLKRHSDFCSSNQMSASY